MQRRPEKELMNDVANAAAYAAADFSEPHNHFIDLLRQRTTPLRANARVLDLGCGTADIMIRFARAYPHCTVDGVDGAEAMLKHARGAITGAGLTQRLRLIEDYLPISQFAHGPYDGIISNSLLHHLHDPDVLWQSVVRGGRSGTQVFVMDLLRPHTPAQARELVNAHAGNESEILQEDFFNSLCAAYRLDEVREQLGRRGLDHLTCEAVSDRHFIVYGSLN